jgi:methyl-accepting chemotaxis protein
MAARGVSVVLVGGDDIEVASVAAELDPPLLLGAVPAAERVARDADEAARRGFAHYACLVFAPGIFVDGEALVAAVRKGAGARAQLAGGLTGDDLTMDRPRVFANGELRQDRVVVTGLFTRKPLGIAARHGYVPVGPTRTVTRADGTYLLELDGRPALDMWLEDARGDGATPPSDPKELALYLANHYELGMPGASTTGRELVARAPYAIRDDGTIQLSASIPEGTKVRVLHGTRQDLLRASTEAAADAVMRAGGRIAGAIVLPCSGRLAALGDAFALEAARIRERIGAPIGGACVYGEIARNPRDADAFFNPTVVIIAFGT